MTAQIGRMDMNETAFDRQSAEYVVDMMRELALIAEDAGLQTVAQMLTVAQAEAEKVLGPELH